MAKNFVDRLKQLRSTKRSYAPGALIFERDDQVISFFKVRSGLVHLLRRQEDGAEFILQRAVAGDVLAEASLSSVRYHCAAVAVEHSVLETYSHAQVQKLIAADAEMARAYANHLGREVRNARLRAEIVTLRRVTDRLDAWLTWNDSKMPEKGTWHRVAGEIGVTPEALYRELARRR